MSRHNRIVLFPWSALQRSHLWPDSSVAARQTFEQRQLWPSQIKKHVDRVERSNEPSTTALLQTPSRSHQQKSLAGSYAERTTADFGGARWCLELGSFKLQDLALEVSKLPRKFSNRSRNVPERSFFFCLKWRLGMELRVTPGLISAIVCSLESFSTTCRPLIHLQ